MTEQTLWMTAALAVACFGGALLFAARTLFAGQSDAHSATCRISGDYYKPMARLLAEDEFGRMGAMGFTRRQVEHLRGARRRVFGEYLLELQRDFSALHQEARILLRDSSVDWPDLAVELVKHQVTFQYAVVLAHCRLTAHSLGLRPVDVRGLLESARWMEAQVEMLRPSPVPNMA